VNDWTEDELKLCWCVATDSSPDDAPKPFPAGVAYKAVDAMQDREYAAEARALKAEAERDYYAKELDKATGMVEMYLDDAAAARLLGRQSEAACVKMRADRDEAIRKRDAALARLQHLERRAGSIERELLQALDQLAHAEGALADIADSEDGAPTREWMEQRARQALAACARIEGQEP
jgi:type I site-specific restriction endonuclease